MDLFAQEQAALDASVRPLADRMRPRRLAEFVGQKHILGEDSPLRTAIEQGRLHSMVLWGPPGTGKTTLAQVVAAHCDARFLRLSAVLDGIKEVRAAVQEARAGLRSDGRRCLLFVDEVHRFNKSQQDAFLPHLEDGTLFLIGATTENPAFELNNALLSRARVYVLKRLTQSDIELVIRDALADEDRGLGRSGMVADAEAVSLLAQVADGDARTALNLLEIASDLLADVEPKRLDVERVRAIGGAGLRRFDKGGDAFYDQISALHKSVRGSDPDAALYWLLRMLDGGCDPGYLARRLLRIASEDIGNADPRALEITLQAWDAFDRLGSPEGELALAQATIFLACAAKSNAVYKAYNQAQAEVRANGTLEVPLHLRNAPTRLARDLGHGEAYRYAHDEPDAIARGVKYFPDEMPVQHFYEPVPRGLEIRIGERLRALRDALDQQGNV